MGLTLYFQNQGGEQFLQYEARPRDGSWSQQKRNPPQPPQPNLT